MSITSHFENLTTEHMSKILQRQLFTTTFYNQTICLFGGKCNEQVFNDTYLFDFASKLFTKVETNVAPSPRFSHSVCLVNHLLYLFGGQNNNEFFKDLWIFNFITKTWSQQHYKDQNNRVPAISDHCLIPISESELLVFGGQKQNKKIEQQQYIYNIIDNSFSVLQQQNVQPDSLIGSSFVKTTKGCILFGGIGPKGFSNELWKITSNKRWELLQPLKQGPIGRAYHQASVIGDDKILIFGGEVGLNQNQKLGDCWVYLVSEKGWRKLFDYEHGNESKPDARSGFGQISWKSRTGNYRVYVFGGSSREGIKGDFWSIQLAKGFNDENVGIIDSLYDQNLIESKITKEEDNVEIIQSPVYKPDNLTIRDIQSVQIPVQNLQPPTQQTQQIPNIDFFKTQIDQQKNQILNQCKEMIDSAKQQFNVSNPLQTTTTTASSDFNKQSKTFSKSTELDIKEDITVLQSHLTQLSRELESLTTSLPNKYVPQQEISHFPSKFLSIETKNTQISKDLTELKIQIQQNQAFYQQICTEISAFTKIQGREMTFSDAVDFQINALEDKFKLRISKIETQVKYFDQEIGKLSTGKVTQNGQSEVKSQCEVDEQIDHLEVKVETKLLKLENSIEMIQQQVQQVQENQNIIMQKLAKLEGFNQNLNKSVRFDQEKVSKSILLNSKHDETLNLSPQQAVNSSHYLNISNSNLSVIEFQPQQQLQQLNFENLTQPKFKQFYIRSDQVYNQISADSASSSISLLTDSLQDVHQYNINQTEIYTTPDESLHFDSKISQISQFNNLLTFSTAGMLKAVPILGDTYEISAFPSSEATSIFTFSQQQKIFSAAGSSSGLIQVWNHKKSQMSLIGAHSQQVGVLPSVTSLFVDLNTLYSGDQIGSVYSYDIVKQMPVAHVYSHLDSVSQIWARNDFICSSSLDGTVRLFDKRSGKSILKAHQNGATGVYCDDKILLSSGKDGILRIWDIRNSAKCVQSLRISQHGINSFGVLGNKVLCCLQEGGVTGINFE